MAFAAPKAARTAVDQTEEASRYAGKAEVQKGDVDKAKSFAVKVEQAMNAATAQVMHSAAAKKTSRTHAKAV
jgi:hypothetical protein